MDPFVITLYCLTDDLLRAVSNHESERRNLTDAEVMTAALVTARSFKGNIAAAPSSSTSTGTFDTSPPRAPSPGA